MGYEVVTKGKDELPSMSDFLASSGVKGEGAQSLLKRGILLKTLPSPILEIDFEKPRGKD